MTHNTSIQNLFKDFVSFITSVIVISISQTSSANATDNTYTIHGGPGGYAPYVIVKKNDEGTVYSGIIHEFLDEFDAVSGYKRETVLMTRKRANATMAQGELIDLMFNSVLFASDEVLKHYAISTTIFLSADVVITRKDQNLEYQGPEDLHKKSVGVIRGYGYGKLDPLLESGIINGVMVDEHIQAIGMLHRKRIDAYLGNIHVSPWYIRQLDLDIADFNMSSLPLYQFEFGFLVSKRKPELLKKLNKFIEISVATGFVDALIEKFLRQR